MRMACEHPSVPLPRLQCLPFVGWLQGLDRKRTGVRRRVPTVPFSPAFFASCPDLPFGAALRLAHAHTHLSRHPHIQTHTHTHMYTYTHNFSSLRFLFSRETSSGTSERDPTGFGGF